MSHPDLNPEFAEDVVVGQVLYEPGCISRAARILKPEHFYGKNHALVFETALELWRDDIPVDLVTMRNALAKRNARGGVSDLDRVGGPWWLGSLTNRVAQTCHLEAHAAIVREHYRLRMLRDAGSRLMTSSNAAADPTELLGVLSADVAPLGVEDDGSSVNAAELAYEIMNSSGRPPTFYLGMSTVDDIVFIRPGNMITVSAESGVGKTAFVIQAAMNMAPLLKVWFLSLEMPATELVMRILCNLAQVDIDLAMEGKISDADREKLARAANEHADLIARIDIDDSGEMDVDVFAAQAEHKVRNEGVGLIVVDYAQLMGASAKLYPTDVLRMEHISKRIRGVLRKLNVPGLVVVHVNRQGQAHGSTQFEKDAHARLKLTREAFSKVMGVDVVKNRNGRTGGVETPCEMRWGIIGHMPEQARPTRVKHTPNLVDFTEPVRNDEDLPF